MGIELKWLLADRIILHRNVGDVTAADLLDVDAPLNAMLLEGAQPEIHVIVLANPDGKGPMSLRAFTAATWMRNERLGWTVVVGLENVILRFAADASSQVFNMKTKFVDTPEEAIAVLKRVDLSLPDDIDLSKVDDYQSGQSRKA
ncbi:MAG: hypothetical protein AAFU54_28965 [Chloroflexota bacterium]